MSSEENKNKIKSKDIDRSSLIKKHNGKQGISAYKDYIVAKGASTADASELEPIGITDLSVDTVNTGRVLVVKTIADAYVISGNGTIQLLVSDQTTESGTAADNNNNNNNHAIIVTIRNFRLPGKVINETSLLFPRGVVLAIKEPIVVTISDNVFVHITHSNNFDFIEDVNYCHLVNAEWKESLAARLPKDIEGWRLRGNDFYTQRYYDRALSCYDLGLAGFDKDHSILQLNKLAALLALQRYYECIPLGFLLLKKLPQEIKIYARMGKAYYALGLYEQASDSYKKLLKISPKYEEAVLYTKKCKERIEERDNGKYDLEKIRKQVKSEVGHMGKEHEQFADCSEYLGPLEIILTETMGRGLAVTKDVPFGTLLMVSRGIGSSDRSDPDLNNMMEAIKQATKHNPLLKAQVSHLYSGGDQLTTPATISDFNQLDGPAANKPIEQARIEGILAHNMILDRDYQSATVSPLASLINHSCLGNATRFRIGDMMFTYATTNIRANQEVFVSINNLMLPSYKLRMEHISRLGVTNCRCMLCQSDLHEPNHIREARHQLDQVFRSQFQHRQGRLGSSDIPLLKTHIKAVKTLNPDFKERLAFDLFSPLGCLASISEDKDALKVVSEILHASGINLDLFDAENRRPSPSTTPIKFTIPCPRVPFYYENTTALLNMAFLTLTINPLQVMMARCLLALFRQCSTIFEGLTFKEQDIEYLKKGASKTLLTFHDTVELINK
ncbi:hypothetical protein DFA_05935 [Cavenderia fasciculata]|uniref:SET domain-containing protein n=1 Tax=Cavenderia fasciculata TaxID=261658 RepID=F4PJM5_CACFS|nr:uncharacterized protein DFA_05935 [Cavenderia fasciculata]EGG23799.1 hypothetical protein DFA_05935 [Cavenderia fasciculata]|eukprot:XP_004361650.1 hypothetical protein DFA_05935 [Cavenderia fasciculata]